MTWCWFQRVHIPAAELCIAYISSWTRVVANIKSNNIMLNKALIFKLPHEIEISQFRIVTIWRKTKVSIPLTNLLVVCRLIRYRSESRVVESYFARIFTHLQSEFFNGVHAIRSDGCDLVVCIHPCWKRIKDSFEMAYSFTLLNIISSLITAHAAVFLIDHQLL